jgi:hypothetical protein
MVLSEGHPFGTGRLNLNIFHLGALDHDFRVPYSPVPKLGCWSPWASFAEVADGRRRGEWGYLGVTNPTTRKVEPMPALIQYLRLEGRVHVSVFGLGVVNAARDVPVAPALAAGCWTPWAAVPDELVR